VAPFEPVDITAPRHKADPYPFYARLREQSPVCRVRVPPGRQEAWLVTRYEDVSALLKDTRLAKDPANALNLDEMRRQPRPPAIVRPLTRNMLGLDDPDHARLKKLVQKTFTPRRVEAISGRTQTIANALLSGLQRRPGFDLIEDYALPLPVAVISDMLGVPEQDRARFARWSRKLITTPMQPSRMLLALPHMWAFVRYLKRLVAQKRREPADDLVSALVEVEEGGGGLDGEELLAMIAILLSAGHETTTNLIGNGVLALLRHPEQCERLRADPSLIETALEELLRFESPAETSTHRYARDDLEIAGTRIPRGSLVLGVIASANRDERAFPDADRLDLARQPNRHLSFGHGGHFCVGAALARMEGRVAIATLLHRLPKLRLAQDQSQLTWRGGLVLRGITRLPVTVGLG
jgi:cytochrome P450 PksS